MKTTGLKYEQVLMVSRESKNQDGQWVWCDRGEGGSIIEGNRDAGEGTRGNVRFVF